MATQIDRDFSRIQRQVRELTGEIGSNPAVRRAAFKGKILVKSKQLTAANPTTEDYNNLQSDVASIIAALNAAFSTK